MANKENFNAPGDFAVDHEECNRTQICFEIAPQGSLGVIEYKKKYRTFVKKQPTTPEERLLMTEAVMGCPFNAFRIKGDSEHPSIKEHAEATTADPTLIVKARASVDRIERREKRT